MLAGFDIQQDSETRFKHNQLVSIFLKSRVN